MAAPRPKKKTIIKKKAPAKKVPIKKTDVKSPEETRKSISRKQVGTNRLQNLVNEGAEGRRLPVQQSAPKLLGVDSTGPKKERLRIMDKLLRKGTPNRATTPRVINQGYTPGSASRAVVPSTAQSTTVKAPKAGVARGLIKKIPVVGAAAGFILDSTPAGTGSTVPGQAQKAVEKKMKREIRQGSKLAVTGVKEGTTRRLAPTGSRKPAPGTNYSGQEKKKKPMKPAPGSNYSGKSSTYSGYGNFNPPKTSAANTAATSAASTSSGGGSQAAAVAKAGGSATNVSKAKVGKQTKYQRNETAMEQKRSSNRPKKSIFNLFRKG